MEEFLGLIIYTFFELCFYLTADIAGNFFGEFFRKKYKPLGELPFWGVIAVHIAGGLTYGAASVFIFPRHLILYPSLRILNLVVSPFLFSFVIGVRKRYWLRRNKVVVRRDKFIAVFLMSLAYVLVRFFFVK